MMRVKLAIPTASDATRTRTLGPARSVGPPLPSVEHRWNRFMYDVYKSHQNGNAHFNATPLPLSSMDYSFLIHICSPTTRLKGQASSSTNRQICKSVQSKHVEEPSTGCRWSSRYELQSSFLAIMLSKSSSGPWNTHVFSIQTFKVPRLIVSPPQLASPYLPTTSPFHPKPSECRTLKAVTPLAVAVQIIYPP